MPIKIGLVDDHSLLRDLLATTINQYEDCRVVLQAKNGMEMISKLAEIPQPDIVIMDLDMDEMDGFAAAEWLFKNRPEIFILILTMYNSAIAMIRLLPWGIRGFLKKSIHPEELIRAIRAIVRTGDFYNSPEAAGIYKYVVPGDPKGLQVSVVLTDSEWKFLQLAGNDISYKEIATEMHVSPKTVENYRDSLFMKFNVKSRPALVAFALRSGLMRLQ